MTAMTALECRTLVCVIAHSSVPAVQDWFHRLPDEWRRREDVQFLILHDEWSPTEVQELSRQLTTLNMTAAILLPLPCDLGWGTRCKVALRIAIDRGYDGVLVLPVEASGTAYLDVLHTWDETEADVVLRDEPGLPDLHARTATGWLNRATGLRLSSYTASDRAYSTAFLQRVPFELNANDEHFAIEILLQAAHVKAQVVTCPPTGTAAEPSRTSTTWRAVCRAAASAVQYQLHQRGMLCTLKLRHLGVERYQDKTQAPYTTHALAVAAVKQRGARRVLDIGCGPGFVAQACQEGGAAVTGVDACDGPQVPLAAFYRADLERDQLPCSPYDFDATLMLDVIEHLSSPEQFLLALRNSVGASPSEQRPLLILSTPNVAFATVRLGLLLGRFNYAERGILDITHKRLFTRSSLLQLLRDCGCDVELCRGVGAPFPAVMPGRLGRVLGWISDLLARVWPSLFAFQFFVVCRLQPGISQLLQRAVTTSVAQTAEVATQPVRG